MARAVLNRDAEARDDSELFDKLWLENETRIIVLYKGKTLIQDGHLKLLTTEQATAGKYRVYLGRTTVDLADQKIGTAVVLSVLSDNAAKAIEPDESKWHELRRSGAGLHPRDAALFTQALAMAGKPMKKMASGGLAGGHKSADGIASKGKTKAKQIVMSGSKGMKKGGYC